MDEKIKKIKKFLEEKEHHVEVSDSRIITKHQFADFEIRISGDLTYNNFPFSLPRLYLLDRNKYGSLAHVGWNINDGKDEGPICEGVTENCHIDFNQPGEIYLRSLNKAVETIKSLLSDKEKNEKEILEEFSGHWRFSVKKSSKNKVISFIEPSDSLLEITPIITNDATYKNSTVFINNNEADINTDYTFLNRIKNRKYVNRGIYLPLDKPILPPGPNDTIIKWWLELLKKLPESIQVALMEKSKRKKTKIFWVISSVQIKENNYSWFCIKFENQNNANPPLATNSNIGGWSALAYNTILHNKEYIMPRGGASDSLANKTIAVIGCGSIGAEVARQLASIGIGKLIFVDDDSLSVENIHRHVLSSKHIGKKKTIALEDELKMQYPYLRAEASNIILLRKCLDKTFLDSVDGIIVATGNPTEERYFNEELFKKEIRPWVIYTWTEGHSVGGHAVYVHSSGKGCLNCLYRDGDGKKSLNSIQNFLESEQDIAVDIAGCGTHFLPYSYTDAIQSAVLAIRLTLYAFENQLIESSRISWKGLTAPDFSLKTTYRYEYFKNSLAVETLFWTGCDVCNS
jgi:hypothetical protein